MHRSPAHARTGPTRAGVTFALRYDETAPTLIAAPSRAPDSNGWYTRAVTVAFLGTDVTSGVVACSSAAYSGSDSPSAAVAGSCRDNAGNVGGGAFSFKYDATAPASLQCSDDAGKPERSAPGEPRPTPVLSRSGAPPGEIAKLRPWSTAAPPTAFGTRGSQPGAATATALKAFDDAANSGNKSVSRNPGSRCALQPSARREAHHSTEAQVELRQGSPLLQRPAHSRPEEC